MKLNGNYMHNEQVPRLTTALSGSLQHLEKVFLDNQITIESWLREQWQQIAPPFYCSVDLRNAGFKLAPVDTNLFPAGFNNLNPEFMPLCIQAMQSVMARICPDICKVLIIPESHTRNKFYLQSLDVLHEILVKAGFETQVGHLDKLVRTDNQVSLPGFEPCLLVLNNDLSAGIPEILQDLKQPIVPSPNLGWFRRLKSEYFAHYKTISHAFAAKLNIDPWLITPLFRNCGAINFMQQLGIEELIDQVEQLFADIKLKYQEYDIKQNPFVVIKADAGTYGMAVMSIQDPEELHQLNRKQRTRMSARKNSQEVNKVIIQEGVHTFETWGKNKATAEPVVYMIGQHVVGGFYRVHSERQVTENLNAPGMQFEPLAFENPCNNPDYQCKQECGANRFYAYGIIGRIAALAAALEIQALNEEITCP